LISESHLKNLCEKLIGDIDCLLDTAIKKLQMSYVSTCDPFKHPKNGLL